MVLGVSINRWYRRGSLGTFNGLDYLQCFNGLAGLGGFQWIEWLIVFQWMGWFGVSVDWVLWVSTKGPGSLGYFSRLDTLGVFERTW